MGYSAQVFNVMVASPSDIVAERAMVTKVVHEWNAVHAYTRRIVLLPLGWETHSSPAMGDHPQHILNKQILEKCDLLVGVFWTRVGTTTPSHESGSVEEVERHVNTGKPVMLYFSNSPVRPDSVDNEQYEKLKAFKASCKSRGLYAPYDDLTDFRDQFNRHLQIKINEHPFFLNPPSTALVEAAPIDRVLESRSLVAPLSPAAMLLLKEAAVDPSGTVLVCHHLGGTDLQTNGKNLITDQSRRSVASWEAALEELVSFGLLVGRGDEGTVFQVTLDGYEVAESLQE